MPEENTTPPTPVMQFADLTVDGETYKLVYDYNAIAEAEAVTRTNLLTGLENLTELTAAQLRGLLYAALAVAHPDITVRNAGKMIRLDTLPTITKALATAYNLSMPEPKSENPTDAPQVQN